MFLFLFSLISTVFSKAAHASGKNFDSLVKKNPISIVLFTSQKCSPCRRLATVLDTVSEKYIGSIGFIIVEFETAQQIPKRYNITYAPTVGVFRDGGYRSIYRGEWSPSAVTTFCEDLLNSDLVYLNSTFAVFDFMQLEPANLIVASPQIVAKSDGLIDKFAGVIHLAVIDNPKVAEQLQFPNALLSRPNDQIHINLSEIDIDHISSLTTSPYMHIRNMEQLAATGTDTTLVALVDERDPLQIRETVLRFDKVREQFGENISFQYCDFFRCSNLVNQMHVINFNNPIFALSMKQGQRSKFEPYQRPSSTPQDILDWCKFHILGEPLPEVKHVIKIPKLYAPDFIQVVSDSTKDVVLLVAAPNMMMYHECLENTRILVQLFKDVPSVKFYEYNPFTEHVQGLDMPKSDRPQYSIWPAAKNPHGSAFQATLSVPTTLDNFIKLFETKIPDKKVKQMGTQLQKLLREMEKEKEKEK